ncbi:hypothetical protein GOV09_05265 [Candidatus Woesearchaeota archaeon]|nr:hypothetical protein [Candidatus Woesearchaeota archaeon]
MAKDKKKEVKIVLERTFNVPLRSSWLKSPKYRRSKRAMTALKAYLVKHMKSDAISIGRYANMKIWEHGIRNPPHHIKVIAKKDEEGKVKAELDGAPEEKPPEPIKKRVKKEEPEAKALEEKVEKVKEEKAEKGKEIEKEEIKELKKEKPLQHAPKKEAKQKDVHAQPTAPAGKSEMRKP